MAKGSRPGGAFVVRTTTDRKTGERYTARPGETIVRKNGRDLLVSNVRRSDIAPGGVVADYSARVGGKWVKLSASNQSALRDYGLAALRRR